MAGCFAGLRSLFKDIFASSKEGVEKPSPATPVKVQCLLSSDRWCVDDVRRAELLREQGATCGVVVRTREEAARGRRWVYGLSIDHTLFEN